MNRFIVGKYYICAIPNEPRCILKILDTGEEHIKCFNITDNYSLRFWLTSYYDKYSTLIDTDWMEILYG
jgi:hypothetical protein